jgi:fumarate hydratase class I
MHDIAHYLRPAHLQQLRNILDDPEASNNDKFVALDLLKNANIAAGGILPMCQDTGTAIVMGKRGQHVLTPGRDEEAVPWVSTTPTPGSTCATPRWRR